MDYTQNLKDAIASLEDIAEMLDQAIIAIAGPDAEWFAGTPSEGLKAETYTISREQLLAIAHAREEANAVLFWVDEHMPGGAE